METKDYDIGQLPKDWKRVKLGDVARVNPKLQNKERIRGDLEIQFLPMKLVEEKINKIHLIETKLFNEVQKGSYTPFINGDIIFAKVTPCMENGKVAIVDNLKNGIGFGSSEFHVLRCNKDALNNYLFHFVVQDKFRNEAQNAMTGAVGLRRVPKQFIEDYTIPLPPKPIQQTIVSKIEELFSELDKGVENLRVAQQQIKTYWQSVLKCAFEGKLTKEWREEQKLIASKDFISGIVKRRELEYKGKLENWSKAKGDLINDKNEKPRRPSNLDQKNDLLEGIVTKESIPTDWEIVPLVFVSDNQPNSIVDGPFGSSINVNEDYIDSGVPVIRMVNIRPFMFVEKQMKFIIESKFKSLKRHNILPEDILIAKVGATIGDCCIYPINQPEAMLSTTGSCRVRLDKKVMNVKFLEYYIFYHKNTLKDTASQTAQPFLNMKVLKSFPIVLPTLEEQNKIVQAIESRLSIADKMEESIIQSLEQAEVLRQSILKKAFEGKLVN